MRIPFIAGNWKMFKTGREVVTFAEDFKKLYQDTDVKTAVCAPYVYLGLLKNLFSGTKIKVGAQNAFYEDEGAFTGEVSVKMLEDLGVDYCIIGHSERRQYFGETDEIVNKKLKRLLAGPITPILCVGENLQQREKEEQYLVVRDQLIWALSGITPQQAAKIVIAYEPVWAIGPGKIPPDKDYITMIGTYIKEITDGCDVVYGGGLKVDNAEMLASVPVMDGGLIALTRFQGEIGFYPEEYLEIIKTYMGH